MCALRHFDTFHSPRVDDISLEECSESEIPSDDDVISRCEKLFLLGNNFIHVHMCFFFGLLFYSSST